MARYGYDAARDDSSDDSGGGDDGGVDTGDVLDGGGSSGSGPRVGGGSDDDEPDGPGGGVDLGIGFGGGSDDDSGGSSDPAPDPAPAPDPDPSPAPDPDPSPSPGGSSPPPSDVGGPSDTDSGTSSTPDPQQGIEGDSSASDRLLDAATGLEQQVTERIPELGSEDVRVTRDGDTLEAELTSTGEATLQNDPTASISSVTRTRESPLGDDGPGGSSPPTDDVGGPSGVDPDDTVPDDGVNLGGVAGDADPSAAPGAGSGSSAPRPRGSRPEDTDPEGTQFGPGPTTRGGLGEPDPTTQNGAQFPVAQQVASAQADQEVVDQLTTGGFLSERGASAGLLPPEVMANVGDDELRVDISETRARGFAQDAAAFGDDIDVGTAFGSPASPLGSGGEITEARAPRAGDPANENAFEEFLEGGARVGTDLPAGVLQAETAAEVAQSAPATIGEEGAGEVGETGVAVGRNAAAATAARAQANPAEFAGGVTAGLLVGAGAGARGTGSLGTAVRAELDPRIGPFGTTAETRAVRAFLDDDRGQADLTGLGVRDVDGSDVDDSPTQFDDLLDEDAQPIASTDPEIDDATSQQFDQATFRAERRRAETRRENDLEDVARDPGPQSVTQRDTRSVTGQENVRTASSAPDTTRSGPTQGQREAFRGARSPEDLDSGVDLSPRESQLAAQLDTPEADLRTRFDARQEEGTVTDAIARQRDAEARFDARGSSLGAGAGGLFGTPGAIDATGADVGSDVFGGVDTDIFGDVGSDADLGLDIGTDTTPDLDPGGSDFFDTDLTDPTADTPDIDTTNPDQDPGRDPGPDIDRGTDPDRDINPRFDDERDSDDEAALFGTRGEDGLFDSGILSGSEALSDLFGGRQ